MNFENKTLSNTQIQLRTQFGRHDLSREEMSFLDRFKGGGKIRKGLMKEIRAERGEIKSVNYDLWGARYFWKKTA